MILRTITVFIYYYLCFILFYVSFYYTLFTYYLCFKALAFYRKRTV